MKKTPRIDPKGYTKGSRAWEPGHLWPTYADGLQVRAAKMANRGAVVRWPGRSEPEATAP